MIFPLNMQYIVVIVSQFLDILLECISYFLLIFSLWYVSWRAFITLVNTPPLNGTYCITESATGISLQYFRFLILIKNYFYRILVHAYFTQRFLCFFYFHRSLSHINENSFKFSVFFFTSYVWSGVAFLDSYTISYKREK